MRAANQPGHQSPPASPAGGATTAPLPPMTTPPRRIGHYNILERLGQGGFGDVYLGRHRYLSVHAAVKVLHEPPPPDQRRAFIREARRLYALRGHPGIVEIREFGFFRPTPDGPAIPFFATDAVPGGRAIIEFAAAAGLDTVTRLSLFARVCDAVHHAHTLGVIHLDLKPSNILVIPGAVGRPPQPRIIDFGIARAADPARERTHPGVQGTIEYMSPEQTTPGAPLDPRSDIYSLGVVLCELLTGRLPYPLPPERVPAFEVIRAAAPDLTAPLPSMVKAVVARALAKDPARRYATAAELGGDIRQVLAGGASGPGPGLARRARAALRRACVRHPRLVAASSVLLSFTLTLYAGVPLLYSWTGASDWFERTFALPPGPVTGANLLLVARTDATGPALGVDPAAPRRALRAVFGRLMAQLAAAPPRALVFDFEFPNASDYDAPFLRGLERLHAARCPVVVGIARFAVEPDGRPSDAVLSRDLSRAVAGWGDLGTYADDRAPWNFPLLHIWADSDPYPSLALVAAATAIHNPLVPPFPTPAYRMVGATPEIHYFPRTDHPSAPRLFDQRLTFRGPVCGLWTVERRYSPPERPGSSSQQPLAALIPLVIPPEVAFEPFTIPLEQVILDAAAAQRCRDKVVLVYDGDNPADAHPYPGGTRRGVFAHAVAIESILAGRAVQRPGAAGQDLIPLIGAAAGLFLPWPLTRRRSWWPGWATAAAAAGWIALIVMALAAGIVAARSFNYLFNPLVLVFAMFTTALLVLTADLVRRSSLHVGPGTV